MNEKPNVGSPIFGAICSDHIPEVMYILLLTVAIPVNYTSEFWELFEATT
jgi:hypothetical protein